MYRVSTFFEKKSTQRTSGILRHRFSMFCLTSGNRLSFGDQTKLKCWFFDNSSTYYGGGGFLTLFTHVVERAEKEASSPSETQQTQNRDPRSGESRKIYCCGVLHKNAPRLKHSQKMSCSGVAGVQKGDRKSIR